MDTGVRERWRGWGRITLAAATLGILPLVLSACEQQAEMAPQPRNGSTAEQDRTRQSPRNTQSSHSGNGAELAPQSQQIDQMEANVVREVNERRKEHGLEPLQPREELSEVARRYSRLMAEKDFFAHESPDGSTVMDRFRRAGLRYTYVGENIFKSWNVSNPASRAVKGWMESKGHRQNILRPQFTETGVGIWKEGKNYYFTQVFRRP